METVELCFTIFVGVTVHGSHEQCPYLEEEKPNEVKGVTDPEGIVSHHLCHDNTGMDGVGGDTCRDKRQHINTNSDYMNV